MLVRECVLDAKRLAAHTRRTRKRQLRTAVVKGAPPRTGTHRGCDGRGIGSSLGSYPSYRQCFVNGFNDDICRERGRVRHFTV
jgi:hypothetical protein